MYPILRSKTVTVAANKTFPVEVFGDRVFAHAASGVFELSFDGENFFPMRAGRRLASKATFDTLTLKNTGATPVTVTLIYGQVEVADTDAAPAVFTPFPTYAALAAKPATPLETGAFVCVITADELAAEFWQLRAWTKGTAPVTNTDKGIIAPVDYDANNNKRAYFRA